MPRPHGTVDTKNAVSIAEAAFFVGAAGVLNAFNKTLDDDPGEHYPAPQRNLNAFKEGAAMDEIGTVELGGGDTAVAARPAAAGARRWDVGRTMRDTEERMETMVQASRSRGMLVWLRSARRKPVRHQPRGEATAFALFFRNLLHGVSLLPVVSMLMMLLAGVEDGGVPNLVEVVLAGLFISLYALVPAITGGLLYLPLVSWAAKRWPRRGRAIAVAAAPLIGLGTVPWGMAGLLALWWAVIPVAAGLLYYGATIRLPVASPAPDAEAAR